MLRDLNIGSKINDWTIISESIIINGKAKRKVKCSCGKTHEFDERYINKNTFSKSCRRCSQIRRNEIEGREYNVGDILMNLEIIKIESGKITTYIVKCLKCGNKYRTGHSALNRKKNNKGLFCCHKCFNVSMKSKKRFTMITENISLTLYKKIEHQASVRGVEFNVTPENLESIFNGHCYLSGIKIKLGTYSRTKGIQDIGNASLDRIDSNKGYVKDNVAWVYKPINVMKHILSVNDFIELCRKITHFNLE